MNKYMHKEIKQAFQKFVGEKEEVVYQKIN